MEKVGVRSGLRGVEGEGEGEGGEVQVVEGLGGGGRGEKVEADDDGSAGVSGSGSCEAICCCWTSSAGAGSASSARSLLIAGSAVGRPPPEDCTNRSTKEGLALSLGRKPSIAPSPPPRGYGV